MFFTTEDLVSAVKRTCMVPTGQNTFTDPEDFIEIANEELQIRLAPKILSARQDFFIANIYIPIVDGVNHYSLPERAIGNSLKDVFFISDIDQKGLRYTIPRAQIHDRQLYAATGNPPQAHVLEGDEIVFYPTPQNPTGYILLVYFMRCNQLVPTSECAKISSIAVAGPNTLFTVELSSDVTNNWSVSIPVGTLVDFLTAKSPFRLKAIDVPIVGSSSTVLSVATSLVQNEALVTTPAVGDYICLAQRANIPMVPQEFHPILSEMVASRVMKALGAAQNAQAIEMKIAGMMNDAYTLISNRVESEVEVIFDRSSLMHSIGRFNYLLPNKF